MRPNITEGKFEKVTEQPWAQGLALGTHRLKESWLQKRFDHLDAEGFPTPLPELLQLPDAQLDATYSVEPGDLNELSTWELMVQTGEMTDDAMRQCSRLPFMEYEVSGWLDFEGLEEAKELLMSPKQRRIQAGVDPMLSNQGLNPEQRRLKNKRRNDRIAGLKKGVRAGMDKMRAMAEEGYDARQIGLRLSVPEEDS